MPKYHNTSLALEAKIKLQTASDKWKAVVNRVDHKTTIFLVSVTLRNDRRFGMQLKAVATRDVGAHRHVTLGTTMFSVTLCLVMQPIAPHAFQCRVSPR